jgi:hypothetical protein
MTEDTAALQRQIGKLEDDLKAAERRIAELKDERDEANDLVRRQDEHVQKVHSVLEQWREAFGMVIGEDGDWTFQPWVDGCAAWRQKYSDLLKDWNKFVGKYNRTVAIKNAIGRPLDASESQVARVTKLHKAGKSLRWIAEEMNLGLQTVRTITGRPNGSDRTSRRLLERIDPDRAAEIAEKSRSRVRKRLPEQVGRLAKQGDELMREARR